MMNRKIPDLTRLWNEKVRSGHVGTKLSIVSPTTFELPAHSACRLQIIVGDDGRQVEELTVRMPTSEVSELPGQFQCVLKPTRALRGVPVRRTPGPQPDLSHRDRSQCPFCRVDDRASLANREVFAEVRGPAFSLNIYHQAAPISTLGHLLAVPAGEKGELLHLPQELSHCIIEGVETALAEDDEWIGFFQTDHAGATVPCAHAQLIRLDRRLPIETTLSFTACPQPVGRVIPRAHPASGCVFAWGEHQELLRLVSTATSRAVPFNVLWLPRLRVTVVFLRDRQQEVTNAFPRNVLGTLEMAGLFVVASPCEAAKLTCDLITKTLTDSTLSDVEVERFIQATQLASLDRR